MEFWLPNLNIEIRHTRIDLIVQCRFYEKGDEQQVNENAHQELFMTIRRAELLYAVSNKD